MTIASATPIGLQVENRRPIRVFVGIGVAPEIACELAQMARALERYPVRLVASADIHLTLVPPWDEDSVLAAIEKLRSVAGRFHPFSLTFERVCYGPQPRRPRVLWAECSPNDEIVALHAALLAACGQVEERPFRPHATVARLRASGSAIARKYPIDQELSLTQRVDAIEFFQSPPPGESGYRVLASLRLGETAQSLQNT